MDFGENGVHWACSVSFANTGDGVCTNNSIEGDVGFGLRCIKKQIFVVQTNLFQFVGEDQQLDICQTVDLAEYSDTLVDNFGVLVFQFTSCHVTCCSKPTGWEDVFTQAIDEVASCHPVFVRPTSNTHRYSLSFFFFCYFELGLGSFGLSYIHKKKT